MSVPLLLNSKRSVQTLSTGWPLAWAGLNFHCRAASSARSAKYWLGPRESNLALETAPVASTATRSLTLNLPWMVRIALGDTSGMMRCATSPLDEAALGGGAWEAGAAEGAAGTATGAGNCACAGCDGWDWCGRVRRKTIAARQVMTQAAMMTRRRPGDADLRSSFGQEATSAAVTAGAGALD